MPSVKQQLAARLREVRSHGKEPAALQLEDKAFDKLCEEMGTKEPVVEGVRVTRLDERGSLINLGMAYASMRWRISMTEVDVASLMKAVPTEELRDLLPIVISQHLDDSGYADPLDEMTADEVASLKKTLKEVGLVDTAL